MVLLSSGSQYMHVDVNAARVKKWPWRRAVLSGFAGELRDVGLRC